MRLIDADELLEHAYRDRLDSRELIADMIKNAPTIKKIPVNVPLSSIIKTLEQKPCEDAISRQAVIERIKREEMILYTPTGMNYLIRTINKLPSVTPKEQKAGWNNHQIACMLADLFGDTCACNFNGIDEWLPNLCDFKDTCCPHPVGVACWEQFLKHSQSRYTECGYEVRDKNALQEPKTGHWIYTGDYITDGMLKCSECGFEHDVSEKFFYCPNCGVKMEE